MGKKKKTQKKKDNLHGIKTYFFHGRRYDPESFFLDDVLKIVKENYKEKKEREISY